MAATLNGSCCVQIAYLSSSQKEVRYSIACDNTFLQATLTPKRRYLMNNNNAVTGILLGFWPLVADRKLAFSQPLNFGRISKGTKKKEEHKPQSIARSRLSCIYSGPLCYQVSCHRSQAHCSTSPVSQQQSFSTEQLMDLPGPPCDLTYPQHVLQH